MPVIGRNLILLIEPQQLANPKANDSYTVFEFKIKYLEWRKASSSKINDSLDNSA